MYLIPTEESLYEISSADSKSQSRKRSRAEQSSATDCSSHRPQQRRRVSITKSVRFATVQVVPAPCTSSPETWYTPVEYSGFKSNVKRDVMYMAKLCQLKQQLPVEHQPKMNKDEYCPLGLEKYCCSTTEQKRAKSVKVARVQAVLDQQAIQQQLLALGSTAVVVDEDAMCTMAQLLSHAACEKALARAARLHHQETSC